MESETARHKSNAVEVSDAKDGDLAVATKSPALQTMEGYDPNRIPSSVFTPSNGGGGDWSSASNESLFSIHMGNNSFSQDYAILYGNTPSSGELPRLDEWDNSRPSDFTTLSTITEIHSQTRTAPKTNNPALRPSDASGTSNASFAFPVLVNDANYSVNMASAKAGPKPHKAEEKPEPVTPPEPESPAQQKPQTQLKVSAFMPKRWFSCFSSCSRPRFCCC